MNASFTFRTADKNSKNMIGGAEMYMPLCRICHCRELKLNKNNHFDGNPELIDIKIENGMKETFSNENPECVAEKNINCIQLSSSKEIVIISKDHGCQ